MSMPGPFELIIIFVIVLLVFGAGKLPEVGRSLGDGIREFRKALRGDGKGKNHSSESKDDEQHP